MLRVAVALALAVFAVIALIVWAAYRPPDWYNPRQIGDAGAWLAEGVERRVLSELSAAHRFGEPWTLAVTAAEAEAWLNVRLPLWIENQGVPRPAWFGFVGVSFESGLARVGLGTGAGGTPPVVSLTLTRSAVAGALPEHAVRLGVLPVPGWIIEQFAPGLGKQVEAAISRSSDPRQANSAEPPGLGAIRLDDGRRVRFTAFNANDGTLTLHCVTLGKP
jgi:hypothetical protein